MMKNNNMIGLAKPDRKEVERDRRLHMKSLCLKLASLVPDNFHFKTSKDKLSQLDQLQLAASYIEQLRQRVERLKRVKEQAILKRPRGVSDSAMEEDGAMVNGWRLPVLEINELGSSIEVVLITGMKKNFMWCEMITVLEDEGAEVIRANFSTVGDKVYHIIHARVRISRLGVETTRLSKRLHDLLS
ncbi:hypothetical protein Tsubulata_030972 [Turnera subulata]|uniref:BHLH domain-containing protein n=1 Tax=Turnera subulata TaxID=218843 RepID=A0A9Q0FCM7_9ROSI|nr:hypothetical protein Tsubulata_030972 [Turnera subulata]